MQQQHRDLVRIAAKSLFGALKGNFLAQDADCAHTRLATRVRSPRLMRRAASRIAAPQAQAPACSASCLLVWQTIRAPL